MTKKRIDMVLKAAENKYGATVADSEILHNQDDFFSTDVLAMNMAISGEIDGGMEAGVLQIVGESKCFKTLYM